MSRRWRVLGGPNASTVGVEVDRISGRKVRLVLQPDYQPNHRITVDLERCEPASFIVGDRVKLHDRPIVGQIAEMSGEYIRLAVPCTRFPDAHYEVAVNECELLEVH